MAADEQDVLNAVALVPELLEVVFVIIGIIVPAREVERVHALLDQNVQQGLEDLLVGIGMPF